MKKVFIGVLAALMLFAFTACENNAPQTPIMGNQIEGVELVSAPDYLIGIDGVVDTAKVELNVIKNDGSKVPYTGAELNMKSDLKLTEEITPVAVHYGNLTFYVNLPAYNWDEITAVDLSGAKQKTIKTTDTEISTEGITVTVSYAKGTRSGVAIEKAITKHGDKITFSGNVASFGYKVGDEINIAEALMKEEVNETISALLDKATGSWVVTVDDSALAISDVSLKQIFLKDNKAYEVFAVGTTKNTLDKVAFQGTATVTTGDKSESKEFFYLAENEEDVITLTNKSAVADPDYTYNTGWTIILQNYTEDFAFEDERTLSVKAVVAYTAGADTVKSNEITVPVEVIEDYPATFSAVTVATKEGTSDPVKANWAWDEAIDPKDFNLKVATWASGLGAEGYEEGKAPALTGTWTANPEKVEKYTPTDEKLSVTFTYSGDHGKAEPNKTVTASFARGDGITIVEKH